MNFADVTVHFVNSALLTFVVALFVLWRYRVAVLDGMQRRERFVVPLPSPGQSAIARQPSGVERLRAHARTMSVRLSAAWLATTFVCGLVLAIGSLLAAESELLAAQVFMLGLVYALASAPMVAVSLALAPMRAATLVTVMLAGFAVLSLGGVVVQRLLSGRAVGWQHLGVIPLFLDIVRNQLWMAAVLWLLSWPARLRGVVPVTFAVLLVFGLAPFVGSRLTAALAATERGTPWVFWLGLNGMFLLMAVPAGWLAWLRLRRLAAAYDAKRFSDAQLLARMWWLMLATTIGLDALVGRGRPWFALLQTVTAVAVFPLVNHGLLHQFGVRREAGAWRARPILFLRPFDATRRTERLFDRVVARWRLIGPVTVIAAPDVVARTIDPGDYLRWLTGHIESSFVTSRGDLDARLAALDASPDPDGRFRINEFCCRDDTWQATVVELMDRADAVIMDVRGVTRERRGCEFELQELSRRLPPQRVVLVRDRTTETGMLEAIFGDNWRHVRCVDGQRARDSDRVYAALAEAAA